MTLAEKLTPVNKPTKTNRIQSNSESRAKEQFNKTSESKSVSKELVDVSNIDKSERKDYTQAKEAIKMANQKSENKEDYTDLNIS